MTHLNTSFKTFGLTAVLAATALSACASTSETPAMTEVSVTTETPTVRADNPMVTSEAETTPTETPASSGKLVLNVSGYKAQSGQIMVAVYNDEKAFDDEAAPFRADEVAVTGPQTVVTFDNLTAGDYAFKVFHDANGNGKLDTNAFGMPTEKYGFSMDASDPFSAPEFEESKFSLSSGENMRNVSLD